MTAYQIFTRNSDRRYAQVYVRLFSSDARALEFAETLLTEWPCAEVWRADTFVAETANQNGMVFRRAC